MGLGPFFIDEQDKFDHEHGQMNISFYMLFIAILTSVMSIWIIIFIKEEPAKFPSASAKNQKMVEFSFRSNLLLLAGNKNYILISIVFMMLYGAYTGIGAIINTITEPYGYTSLETSLCGVGTILSGVIGSFIFSSILDKHKKFLLTVQILCLGSLITTCCMCLTLNVRKTWLLAINTSLCGFFIVPIIPVAYTFAVELTYPVSEPMSNGIMMLLSQILGTAVTYYGTMLANIKPVYCINLFIAQMVMALTASMFIQEDLRRLKVEKDVEMPLLESKE